LPVPGKDNIFRDNSDIFLSKICNSLYFIHLLKRMISKQQPFDNPYEEENHHHEKERIT
jgi:hypothetical protein